MASGAALSLRYLCSGRRAEGVDLICALVEALGLPLVPLLMQIQQLVDLDAMLGQLVFDLAKEFANLELDAALRVFDLWRRPGIVGPTRLAALMRAFDFWPGQVDRWRLDLKRLPRVVALVILVANSKRRAFTTALLVFVSRVDDFGNDQVVFWFFPFQLLECKRVGFA